jgi:hypothetical protein
MATTYTLISSVTVGSGGAANIEFTSIPATYTDLVVSYSARCDLAGFVGANIRLQFNSDTGSNYSYRRLYADGSNAYSDNATSQTSLICGVVNAATSTSSTFNNGLLYIPNYAGSNQKTVSSDSVQETNGTEGYQYLIAGLWNQTNAITSIKLFVTSQNLLQYSTAYLYGISNA